MILRSDVLQRYLHRGNHIFGGVNVS